MSLPPDFSQTLHNRSDGQLYEAIAHPEDYLPEALDAIRAEFARRNLPAQPAEIAQHATEKRAWKSGFRTPFKRIVAVATVLLGVFFLLNSGSDIQLGFGFVLISQGLLNWD